MFDERIEIELSNEIKYAKNGMEESSNRLVMYAPTIKNYHILAKMRPYLTTSFYGNVIPLGQKMLANMDNTDNVDDSEDKEGANDATIAMVLDTCVDYDKFYDLFIRLFLIKGICMINDDECMKDGYLQSISPDDMDNIVRKYTCKYLFPKHLLNPKS